MMLIRSTLAAAALGLVCAGPLFAAESMSKDQVKTEKERIASDAKAARDKCKDLKGNAKDVCMAEAKGQEKLAKAELEAKQKDTPKARYDVAVAKADVAYNVAKEKCEDMKGKDEKACKKDAKTAQDEAKKQAKADREAADGKKERTADASRRSKDTK
jgi:hypothetical protein